MRCFNIVIVRLDRTIQNLSERLEPPIKSGDDKRGFHMLLAVLIVVGVVAVVGCCSRRLQPAKHINR